MISINKVILGSRTTTFASVSAPDGLRVLGGKTGETIEQVHMTQRLIFLLFFRYSACHGVNLNGINYNEGNTTSYADGITYKAWRGKK